MRSTYPAEDVTILLKDITGMVEPLENEERERRIQSGTHYSEMLPKEHLPSAAYLQTFELALQRYSPHTAAAVRAVSDQIVKQKKDGITLVSLARAGTPIGILLKRDIQKRYGLNVPHYTISIIRGRGIDRCAMDYILQRHAPQTIQFVDGWTGKGAIKRQLAEAMGDYPAVAPSIAVLSDPAYVADICGTHTDFLIPSSCLNSTVSGLMSRTFYRRDIIREGEFHGAIFYDDFAPYDQSIRFLDAVENGYQPGFAFEQPRQFADSALDEVRQIAADYRISDINFVKPGIGEATRVLLRRIPWKILVHSLDDPLYLGHIYELAREKNIPLETRPLRHYKACGLIRQLADT